MNVFKSLNHYFMKHKRFRSPSSHYKRKRKHENIQNETISYPSCFNNEIRKHLFSLHLIPQYVLPNGNCFYLALSDQLVRKAWWRCDRNVIKSDVDNIAKHVRKDVISNIEQNIEICQLFRAIFPAKNNQCLVTCYITRHLKDKTFTGDDDIILLSAATFYNVTLNVFHQTTGGVSHLKYHPINTDDETSSSRPQLYICLINQHYWSTKIIN